LPAVRPKDTIVIPSIAENAGAVAGDKFQILGAVRAPGMYRISAANNVIEAISISGGALPEANLAKVLVTRPSNTGATTYELDIEKYLKEGRPVGQLELKPGDTVTIQQSHGGGGAFLDVIMKFAPLVSVAASVLSVVWVRR
jgi:protein involved in polysaccharide export with SLBB domain